MSKSLKETYIEHIKNNGHFDDYFLLLQVDRLVTRNGKPYLNLVIGDKTGSIEARVWDKADTWYDAIEKGQPVRVVGQGNSYQGKLQVKVEEIWGVPIDTVSMQELVPASKYDIDHMITRLKGWFDNFNEPWLKTLCDQFISDTQMFSDFTKAPAAKKIHHAWYGGLLEHTLAVMKLADSMGSCYPEVNRDLLLTGAFLHDMGKVKELSQLPVIEYSDQGRLIGHIALCLIWIEEKVRNIEGFPEDLMWHVQHLVASHHGTLEQGAIQVPKTIEAEILHQADLLDSKMEAYRRIMKEDHEEGNENWTRYQGLYQKHLFRGERNWTKVQGPVESGASKQGAENKKEQAKPQPKVLGLFDEE